LGGLFFGHVFLFAGRGRLFGPDGFTFKNQSTLKPIGNNVPLWASHKKHDRKNNRRAGERKGKKDRESAAKHL